jgi:hypothetical protein
MSDAPGPGLGLGQQALGPNPTANGRLLAADLDHLVMQVTPETVLQIRNVILGAAQRLQNAFRREARNVQVGPPGGDPISGTWANVTNKDKIPPLLAEFRSHADAFDQVGEKLRQTALCYGHTEQEIEDSFKKFLNANQGAWGQQLKQDEAQAGLPPRIRDLIEHPPSQPGPQSGADLFRGRPR